MKPKRYKPEFAVQAWVEDESRRFRFPDLDTLPSPGVPGGGGGMPTVVVAASDASDLSKSKADLICDGTNDQVIIQQALDLLPTTPRTSGRLVFTEGTFSLIGGTSSDIFDVSNQRWIQGSGKGSTLIYVSGNATTTGLVVFDIRGDSTISDLRIEKDPGLTLNANSYAAIGMFGELTAVRNVDILQVGGSGGTVRASIWSGNGLQHVSLTDVYIANAPEDAIYMQGNDHVTMQGIHIVTPGRRGIHLNTCWLGNSLTGIQVDAADDDAIWLDSCDDVTMAGINAQSSTQGSGLKVSGAATGDLAINGGVWLAGAVYGLEVDDVTGCLFQGIHINTAGQHGIFVNAASNNKFDGCLVKEAGMDTANTYDGIHLAGDSNENTVIGNTIISQAQIRYGINVSAAACNDNAVYANYLGDTSDYGTNDSNDAGTGTQVTPAGGAIGGQFAI